MTSDFEPICEDEASTLLQTGFPIGADGEKYGPLRIAKITGSVIGGLALYAARGVVLHAEAYVGDLVERIKPSH